MSRPTLWINWLSPRFIDGSLPRSIDVLVYGATFIAFLGIMVNFIAPTFDKPFSWFAVLICIFLLITPKDRFHTLVILLIPVIFLELWGPQGNAGLITFNPAVICRPGTWNGCSSILRSHIFIEIFR
jgi:hypothetical protein